jgi:hypothetical protein
MPTTGAWTLATDATGTSGFQGVANIGGGRLLAVRLNREVWRRAAGTWTQIGTVGGAGTAISRLLSLGLDECLVAVANDTGNTDQTYRTTDGGDTWTSVDSVTSSISTGAYGFVRIGATDEVIAFGQWNPTGGAGVDYHFRRSLDRGATWAAGVLINTRDVPIGCMAYVNGVLIAGTITETASDTIYRSTASPWTTWSAAITLPGNMTGDNRNIWWIEPVSGNIALATGGFINDADLGATPNFQVLWIWRTTDAGATWSRIADASILNSPADNVSAAAILKISATLFVIGYGFQDQPHADAPGWRASDDAGLTWNVVNTSANPPDGTFYSPAQMVLDDAGVVVSVAALDEAANGGGEIWNGVFTTTTPGAALSPSTLDCGHPITHSPCVTDEV